MKSVPFSFIFSLFFAWLIVSIRLLVYISRGCEFILLSPTSKVSALLQYFNAFGYFATFKFASSPVARDKVLWVYLLLVLPCCLTQNIHKIGLRTKWHISIVVSHNMIHDIQICTTFTLKCWWSVCCHRLRSIFFYLTVVIRQSVFVCCVTYHLLNWQSVFP